MSAFNTTISNRLFAAFLSILLAIPTGLGLVEYWTHDSSTDNKEWLSQTFVNAGMDVVALAFAFSVLGIVWAAFLPPWVERLFQKIQHDFAKSLGFLLCIILLMLVVGYLAVYFNISI